MIKSIFYFCLLFVGLEALAQDFHGKRIHARININQNLYEKISKALDLIERGLEQPSFYQKIADTKKFTCLTIPHDQVLKKIQESSFEIELQSEKLSDVVTASTSYDVITLNHDYEQSVQDWSNTLFHEMLHVIGFSHCGLNNPRIFRYILKSVPYKVGDYMEETISALP
jgi:hypothetical protein